jgi:hypothetical protein
MTNEEREKRAFEKRMRWVSESTAIGIPAYESEKEKKARIDANLADYELLLCKVRKVPQGSGNLYAQ